MKQIRIRCFLSLLLILIISFTLVSYAWLSTVWNSEQSIWNFSVGTVPPPIATMWLYSTDFEESNAEERGWIEHSLMDSEQAPHAFLMPKVKSEENNGVYTFEMKSLHLGTVDNLVIMNPDNIVCLRFAFDSKAQGNSTAILTADLSDALGQKFQIYDSNGYAVIDESLKNDLMELHSQNSFLQYQACVSAQELSPNDDAFQSLVFSEEMLFGTELDLYGDGGEAIEDEYYIYIKIMPNLSAFAPASELLNAYMPCVILFDAQIQLTVY